MNQNKFIITAKRKTEYGIYNTSHLHFIIRAKTKNKAKKILLHKYPLLSIESCEDLKCKK